MMKTRLILLTIIALFVSSYGSEAQGKEITRNFKVGDFTDIHISGGFDVYFVQGNTTSIKVTGKEDDVMNVKITKKGKNLSFVHGNKSNGTSFFSKSSGNISVFITSPNLRAISIIGSGAFYAKEKIDTDIMKITISGSGYVSLKDIICDKASMEITGSGSINASKIITAKASSTISGSGTITLNNATIISAQNEIYGSGTIKIRGKVKNHNGNVYGSGSISIK